MSGRTADLAPLGDKEQPRNCAQSLRLLPAESAKWVGLINDCARLPGCSPRLLRKRACGNMQAVPGRCGVAPRRAYLTGVQE